MVKLEHVSLTQILPPLGDRLQIIAGSSRFNLVKSAELMLQPILYKHKFQPNSGRICEVNCSLFCFYPNHLVNVYLTESQNDLETVPKKHFNCFFNFAILFCVSRFTSCVIALAVCSPSKRYVKIHHAMMTSYRAAAPRITRTKMRHRSIAHDRARLTFDSR